MTGDGVVDRDTGRTLWRAPSAGIYLSTSRPGSDDVLLFAYGSSNARATGIIVRSNGSQVALPAGYL